MTCEYCASGGHAYDFKCLQCCARLVRSGRPSKRIQYGLLMAISFFQAAPPSAAIIDEVRRGV